MSLRNELSGIDVDDAQATARASVEKITSMPDTEVVDTLLNCAHDFTALAMIRVTITNALREGGVPESELTAADVAMSMMVSTLITLADIQELPKLD